MKRSGNPLGHLQVFLCTTSCCIVFSLVLGQSGRLCLFVFFLYVFEWVVIFCGILLYKIWILDICFQLCLNWIEIDCYTTNPIESLININNKFVDLVVYIFQACCWPFWQMYRTAQMKNRNRKYVAYFVLESYVGVIAEESKKLCLC